MSDSTERPGEVCCCGSGCMASPSTAYQLTGRELAANLAEGARQAGGQVGGGQGDFVAGAGAVAGQDYLYRAAPETHATGR